MRYTVEQAIQRLRADPNRCDLIFDSYLDEDPLRAAKRYSESEESKEVLSVLSTCVGSGPVLDLGCGRGMASFALARCGIQVIALEPDQSADIGARAAAAVLEGLGAPVVGGGCPGLPFKNESFAAVYVRQVLHHLRDLPVALQDIARVLRRGGVFLATREHVVDNDEQLASFLANHPVHQMAGGEGAFSLKEYIGAIEGSGLQLDRVIGPWQSVINAFPVVRDKGELDDYPSIFLGRRIGRIGSWLGALPPIREALWRRFDRPVAGRMFSFIARKL